MSELEKPERVEVGQRYRGIFSEKVFTIVEGFEDGSGWEVEYEDGERMVIFDVHGNGDYLGGPTPPVSPVGPVKEVNGYPTACLMCGTGEVGGSTMRSYICQGCVPSPFYAHATPQCEQMVNDWRGGARDFPRRTPESAPQELTGVPEKIGASGVVARVLPQKRPHDFNDPYAISMCDPMDGSPLVRVPVCKACGWRSDIPQTSTCIDNPSWRLTMDSAVQHCTAKRSVEKREARKESPFQQSHCGRNGMLGIFSLREEER